MNTKTDALADAIRAKHGNLTAAADALGMARAKLAARVAASEYLRSVVDDERGKIVDFAESALRKAIANGEDWAIRYVLDSARASPRGWRKPPASTPSGDAPTAPAPQPASPPPELTPEARALAQLGIGPDGR